MLVSEEYIVYYTYSTRFQSEFFVRGGNFLFEHTEKLKKEKLIVRGPVYRLQLATGLW